MWGKAGAWQEEARRQGLALTFQGITTAYRAASPHGGHTLGPLAPLNIPSDINVAKNTHGRLGVGVPSPPRRPSVTQYPRVSLPITFDSL